MQYRSFPRIPNRLVSLLGFGCMRLPTLAGDATRIDEEAATRLLHQAIQAGVNYVDTAWPYHGERSEPFVGRALRGGWREKVLLATKHPVWLVKSEADWERYLDLQLERLQVDHVDCYLLHALNAERWEVVRQFGGLAALERAQDDGRIGHLGFSFHGALDDFKRIAAAREWDFCQIQLNFLDEEYQAGIEGLRYAAERRIGVVVMEPLRGGALAKAPPAVQEIWARSPRRWSPAEWALRWVWDRAGVVTALSGMNAEAQLRENLQAAASAEALSPEELAQVDRVKRLYRDRIRVPCTTCGYCQPCPNQVAIPSILSLYNDAAMFESCAAPAALYDLFCLKRGAGGDRCTECGECESKCPQGLPIARMLKEAHACLIGS